MKTFRVWWFKQPLRSNWVRVGSGLRLEGCELRVRRSRFRALGVKPSGAQLCGTRFAVYWGCRLYDVGLTVHVWGWGVIHTKFKTKSGVGEFTMPIWAVTDLLPTPMNEYGSKSVQKKGILGLGFGAYHVAVHIFTSSGQGR